MMSAGAARAPVRGGGHGYVYRNESERRRRRIAAQTPSLCQCGKGGTLTLSNTVISDNTADAGAANAAVERHDRTCPTAPLRGVLRNEPISPSSFTLRVG
jgi:hypothetical protein